MKHHFYYMGDMLFCLCDYHDFNVLLSGVHRGEQPDNWLLACRMCTLDSCESPLAEFIGVFGSSGLLART